MNWTEKEYAWERTYESGRIARDIEKYIPQRLSIAVSFTSIGDGYWIYLNDGWEAYDGGSDCHTIHEYRISDLKDAIKTIRRKERA